MRALAAVTLLGTVVTSGFIPSDIDVDLLQINVFDDISSNLGRRLLGGNNFKCTTEWEKAAIACASEKPCEHVTSIHQRAQCLLENMDDLSDVCRSAADAVYKCIKCQPQLEDAKRECSSWLQTKCTDSSTPKARAKCYLKHRSSAPKACDAAAQKAWTCATTHGVRHWCVRRHGVNTWHACKADIKNLCQGHQTIQAVHECMRTKHEKLSQACKAEASHMRSCLGCGEARSLVVLECAEKWKKLCSHVSKYDRFGKKMCFMSNYHNFSEQCLGAIKSKKTTCLKHKARREHVMHQRGRRAHHHHRPCAKRYQVQGHWIEKTGSGSVWYVKEGDHWKYTKCHDGQWSKGPASMGSDKPCMRAGKSGKQEIVGSGSRWFYQLGGVWMQTRCTNGNLHSSKIGHHGHRHHGRKHHGRHHRHHGHDEHKHKHKHTHHSDSFMRANWGYMIAGVAATLVLVGVMIAVNPCGYGATKTEQTSSIDLEEIGERRGTITGTQPRLYTPFA